MMWLKRFIVHALSSACYAVDRLPWWLVACTPLRWLGCPHGMATWSDQLDQRWGTGVWQPPQDEDHDSECEAEWIGEAGAWTACGCHDRVTTHLPPKPGQHLG